MLAYCARRPDRARVPRGCGPARSLAVPRRCSATTASTGLCYFGANVVPSGRGCWEFAGDAASRATRMIIGQEDAVTELWSAAQLVMPSPREDRPGQPVYVLDQAPEPGSSGLRAATLDDLDLLVPACALTHEEELGVDPLAPGSGRFPAADGRADRGGPFLALGRERDDPVQGRGLGVDAERRPAPAGVGRPGSAAGRQRHARAQRPLPAPPRAARRRSASSCAPRTRPRCASTRRSACARKAPTAASFSNLVTDCY